MLGDWISADNSAEISDFSATEDTLLFVWDDSDEDSEEPDVTLVADPDNAGQMQVRMGNEVVAQVAGSSALSEADIALIPLSVAASNGLLT